MRVRRFVPAAAARQAFALQVRRGQAVTACHAAADGLFVAWTLRRRGLRPLVDRLPAGHIIDPDGAQALGDTVDAGLGLLPLSPTCLRRSVTLVRAMRRRDLDGTICIGVRAGAGGVDAHAWVEVGGRVVNDDGAEIATYERLSGDRIEQHLADLR